MELSYCEVKVSNKTIIIVRYLDASHTTSASSVHMTIDSMVPCYTPLLSPPPSGEADISNCSVHIHLKPFDIYIILLSTHSAEQCPLRVPFT